MGTIVNIDPTDDVCGVVFVDDGKIGRLYILSIFITQLLKMLKCPRLPATRASEDFLIQSTLLLLSHIPKSRDISISF